ncbi:M16 family metallopeptidase [Cyanobacterium aponinum]|uniref:Insulinase family protein n=1 Tax=Cyanobacterium aponinum 0216 TaxID=2676140 RepID=A0A844GV21_9CHRO|nr:pitrilysin family protein [Cyanobacterium aponinum]MTF38075.1 insulinase family protein [Cyanobacterium aponinum 0216]
MFFRPLYKAFIFGLIIFFAWTNNCELALAKISLNESNQSIEPYLNQVKEDITEFTLSNGIHFIVLENHQAPVISFNTYVDVGGANEPEGKTGVAHFLEHLAFKGTKEIGTINYEKEKQILEELDKTFQQIKEAKKENNQEQLTELENKFEQLNNQAHNLVKQNEFGQIIELEGGVGLNAATSADSTVYFYNFPSNKLELWMYLESDRFLNPVFREFYQEKQVILEERKLRTDNSPVGKMVEAFLDSAFTTHPYKRPVIGYEEDIINLTREDVQNFFDSYYGGNNITIAIVGDVDPKEVKQMANKYFGRFPSSTKPAKLNIVEPKQTKTREVAIEYPSQPWYLEGYHIPNINDPDYVVYDIISSILSSGRTSRLYQSLVDEQKIALSAAGFNGFPGDKYPNLMLFYAMLAPERQLEDLEVALHEQIEKLKSDLVTEEELQRVKTQARASLLRSLNSNAGMAKLLAEYQAKTGDWRNLFLSLDKISAVTAQDIQRVAQNTFTSDNKTVGRLITKLMN